MELRFEIIKDLKEAEKIWKGLSPNLTLYDDWNFRYCFYKYHTDNPLLFYAGYLGDELIGLLPLQYNSKEKYLEFWSEEFMEDNHVFIKKGFENLVPRFYEEIKEPAKIYYIVDDCHYVRNLPIEDYKYILNLAGFKDYREYLESAFEGKSKKNLKREISIIEKNPVAIREDEEEDLDLVFGLNINTFKEESDFHGKNKKEIFRDFLKLDLPLHLMSIEVNGEKLAASVSILYNKIFYLLSTGSDNKKIPNLGKYLIFKNIEKAISLGAEIFDVGVGDCGWKERFRLERVPQYKFNYPPSKNAEI